eukprot:Pgem_evm1s11423
MPYKCVVPFCKSNYRSNTNDYVTVFKFPPSENEVFAAWKRFVILSYERLSNHENGENDDKKDKKSKGENKLASMNFKEKYVCVKHFIPDDVRSRGSTDSNGLLRKKTTLKRGSVPQVFCADGKVVGSMGLVDVAK